MSAPARPPIRQQIALLTALRGGTPVGVEDDATAAALLRRYECGGWLHARRRAPGAAPLPEPWRSAAARAHQKTMVDSLGALGIWHDVGTRLATAEIPVLVLKGAAYLAGLYDDPGERPLTDVDLLLRPGDAARAAEALLAAGFAVVKAPDSDQVAEYRRFEMARPGPAPCGVEIHWHLGTAGRVRFDQGSIWSRAQTGSLQGVACLLLEPHDNLLYHVGHAAEHYFGPTLKWALDLRAMFERWRVDPDRLLEGARAAGVRTALHLALRQLETLFPGTTPEGLSAATEPGTLQRRALARLRLDEPLEFLPWASGERRRAFLRPLLFDTPGDALAVALAVLRRPWQRRHGPPPERPWEAAVASGLPGKRTSSVD